jgi:hypothetical protein
MTVLDQLGIRSQIQLGTHPAQLDELDTRSIVMPAVLASRLEMLAGPQMAPIWLDGPVEQGTKRARPPTRSPSVG